MSTAYSVLKVGETGKTLSSTMRDEFLDGGCSNELSSQMRQVEGAGRVQRSWRRVSAASVLSVIRSLCADLVDRPNLW